MDHLKSLESSLPPEQPPTENAIQSLSSDSSQEFKIAANAVTKLYRVANEKNSLLKHQGYISCLDDISELIEKRQVSSLDEIRHWCMKQKIEKYTQKMDKPNTNISTNINADQNQNNKYNFQFSSNGKTGNIDNSIQQIVSPKFKPSMAPMSVEHSFNEADTYRFKKKWSVTRRHANNAQKDNENSMIDSLNYDMASSLEIGDDSVKYGHTPKKPKYSN
ncbi:uncharacterized protein NDAI_0B01110 [Naumovozyma dairenensis CBS 421]|uniref:YJR056C-like protein n=1 Tax=Naumovozyma dairenensis (strain ATCC 10597 / BCRC 20456 / CBS 421 / NBRC 0211 / NRRL Y-12639) TaxID=1071378 RepID=G0W5T4_NAUDC|nr:hypothetical protein NDAI_0B01110 [Naumovozyma dairenensis CBS 421]CCD23145.1 hypothetical protein NDAI_0B01110 [Naumovozyma dairenensis CBS 421]